MMENNKEISLNTESYLNKSVMPVEDTLSDGELWEMNLMLGIGNDVY